MSAEFLQLIREVGFPAAVALLVLWRLDAHLIEMRNELRELRSLLGDRRKNLSAPPA